MSDLFQRYLDGTLSPEELADLDAVLRDPAAAERFAALSRLDADLSAHFREEARLPPLPPRRAWAARLALAACLLLLAGAGLVWWSLLPVWPRDLVAGADGAVTLPDGSVVTLAAGSRARLWPRRVELFGGEGGFVVRPGDDAFEVTTPAGRVTVVGTTFRVSVSEEGTMTGKAWVMAVAVTAGLVEVGYDGEAFRLGAGQSAVYGREEGRPRAEGVRGVLAEEGGEGRLTLRGRERGSPTVDVEVGKGAKVMVDGKPGQLTGLPRGTRVLIEKDARGGVVAVRAEGAARLAVVSAVGKGAITVQQRIREGQPAEKVTYPAAGAAVTVEGRPATLTDLKPGDRVTLLLSVDGKRVVALRKGEGRERGRDGDRGARSVRAVIEEIDTKAGTITLGGGERKRALTVAKGVKVTVNGKPGKLEDVKAGGRAVITVTLKEPVEVQAIAVSPPRE